MSKLGNYFNSEYKINIVERISQIGNQAMAGAEESAPVILGKFSYIDKQRADAEYGAALSYYKKDDGSVTSDLLSRYAENAAGKNKKWEIDKNITTNPVTKSLLLGLIIPFVGFFIGLIVFGLQREFASKAEARRGKEESLKQYPEKSPEASKEQGGRVELKYTEHADRVSASRANATEELGRG